MRKLKLQVHISLDGFIAGPNGESEWVHTGSGQQPVIDLADTCDTILMGRKMARDFIDHWENVVGTDPGHPLAGRMVRMCKIVFSRTQTAIPGRNVEVAGGDLATTVRVLKNEPGKDLLVYGGAGFVSNLIELDLVDEYHLFVIPVALGEGMRIFKMRKKLKLIRSVAVGHLETISTYVPA